MPSSDALLVSNDWISEYYFTSDQSSGSFVAAVKNRVKAWKEEAEEFSGSQSPLDAFTGSRNQLLSELIELQEKAQRLQGAEEQAIHRAELGAESTAFADHLRTVLGLIDPSQVYGPLRFFSAPSLDQPTVAVLDALAVDSVEDLLSKRTGYLPEDVLLPADDAEGEATTSDPLTSVSAVMSALINMKPAPVYVLVIAGRHLLLTSTSGGWAEGRYLTVDIQTIAERGDTKSGGEIQRAIACVSADTLTPQDQGSIWWDARREESVRNAVGVSSDLRDGVRDSIEIIANEVVDRRKAQGLEPLPDDAAQELAIESLRYLFRILFLLYAEASPELGVVPAGDPDYESGYSLDRLRELTLKPLSASSESGTHLYESLQLLFDLVERGHTPPEAADHDGARSGLTFEAMRSDLFRPDRTRLIDGTRLGNASVQQVLQNLLLTKEKRGRNRGFISYAALGINQLGAVYESLMSYTGSFASETLVEVARNGDASGGSWVVPERRLDEELRKHVVMVHDEDGRESPRTYHYGEFVFRLSGRERQRSASYYSPKVLTEFTVQQGLDELLTEETTAEEVLSLSVCEPALGSGAFAIEAVNQLAAEYLARRQAELGERIDPDTYPQELQRVKTYIALHNVYGVDLNPTAVELAEVSLWLDTMARGLKAPWFGLRLRSGNSLVGGRHAVYPKSTVEKARPTEWMKQAPTRIPLDRSPGNDGIFHFLLPAEGWGAAGGNKEIKSLAPDEAKALRDWSKRVAKKPNRTQVKELVSLSERIHYLWGLVKRRMVEAERQSRRSIPVWGAEVPEGGAVTREEIEASLKDPNSAYRRLRLVLDAWCALWFWPVLKSERHGDEPINPVPEPPEFEEWLQTIRRIVGTEYRGEKKGRQVEFIGRSQDEWTSLEEIELMLPAEGADNIEALMQKTPWLAEVRRIAKEQRFFHWELDFAAVFARGGFDLQVGNPPWVRPDLDVASLLGDHDPWWTLTDKPSETARNSRRPKTLALSGAEKSLLKGAAEVAGTAAFASGLSTYPELSGIRPDLYRDFMARTWSHASDIGVTALVHPPTHFTDAKAYVLRHHTYRHLRRHWGFINELMLFSEVDDHVTYSINIYGPEQDPDFLNAIGMYHPETPARSLDHDGSGPEPGFKNDDGKWDLRPHRARVQRVRMPDLKVWHQLMEGGSSEIPVDSARMVYTVNSSARDVLNKIATAPSIGVDRPQFSNGWNETTDRRNGYFESTWGEPESWKDVILQGPYFHVGNPFYNSRNPTMGGNQDYSRVDLETLAPDARPVTEYKPIYEKSGDDVETSRYDEAYGTWETKDPTTGDPSFVPVRSTYRVMWRAMAAGTGERTLIPAVYPPGVATVHSVFAEGYPGKSAIVLPLAVSSMGSLLSDFLVRATVGSGIFKGAIDRLPRIPEDHPLAGEAALRALRLNCLTDGYAKLWSDCWQDSMTEDSWTGGNPRTGRGDLERPALGDVGPVWSASTPLRLEEDRRQALVELDAIMALVTGVDIEELCTLYRTQFGVLYNYDRGEDKRAYVYDANGRVIPTSVRTVWNKADRPEHGLSTEERTYTNPAGRTIVAEEPFRILDREQDMRVAYAEFERRMQAAEQKG